MCFFTANLPLWLINFIDWICFIFRCDKVWTIIQYTIVKRNLESWHQTWCYMSLKFHIIWKYKNMWVYKHYTSVSHTAMSLVLWYFFVMFGHFCQSDHHYFNGWIQFAWTLWRHFSFSTHFLILFLLVDHIVLPKKMSSFHKGCMLFSVSVSLL